MKTYTILATNAWEKIDNTYLSLVCSIVPEADTYLSYDGGTTSVLLPAGKGISVSLQTPDMYVYGTINKKIYVYDGAIQTISDIRPLNGSNSPNSVVTARFIGDLYIDNVTGNIYTNPTAAITGWTLAIRTAAALTSGKYPIASTGGVLIDGPTPLAGTKVYYVSDTSGGAVTRKLTFTNGILTSET